MSEQAVEAARSPGFDFLSPDFLRNPYPAFQMLRANAPILKTEMGFWVASRYDDVTAILRDKRFGKCFVERIEHQYGGEVWN